MFTQAEHAFMQETINLASRGLGKTWPNPMVGALVVRKGIIIGRGWHRRYGCAHAEVHALRQAGAKARGATLFVNLEPCSHFGRTPPCTQAIIQAGIDRVVASIQDPNPKVFGRGFAQLRRAGVKVTVGLLAPEARELNKVFITRISHGRPYVLCKAAMTLDGKIACSSGASQWISSLPARRYVHQLRGLADAVIVGARTVIKDDPELTVRLSPRRRPTPLVRVVIEGKQRISKTAKLIRSASDQAPVIIVTTKKSAHPLAGHPGVQIWKMSGISSRVPIGPLLNRLGLAGMSLVMVEGGGEVHADFLGVDTENSDIWADEVQFILAPKIFGGRTAPGPVGGGGIATPAQCVRIRDMTCRPLGPDWLLTGFPAGGDYRRGEPCLPD